MVEYFVSNERYGETVKEEIKNGLAELFGGLGIEYFAAARIGDLKTVKPYLLNRLPFSPSCAVVFLVPYYVGGAENISEYAAARDYHLFIKSVGDSVRGFLKSALGAESEVFGDRSPIDERDAAARCGLGIIGDNGLLINGQYGSYVFIGEVITDARPQDIGASELADVVECEHCGRCRAACPAAEIGDCLSALTQKKGALTDAEREMIGKYGSAWGCDLCQRACPHNKNPKVTPIPFFKEQRTPVLDSRTVMEMSDAGFAERAYSWRGREPLLRNLEILEKGT